jgi:hypothetical protein
MNYMMKVALLAVILPAAGVQTALAIPAFARKYDMSCITCHAIVPKLKAYGEEFAGNGFVLADKEAPRFFRDTGDDMLLLMREVPLALRLEGYFQWQPQARVPRTEFTAPYFLKLLSGGQIAKDVSYYFYFFFSERGEIAGIEDAFVYFNDLFNSEIDLAVGQFQVSDPLFKRELRLTLADYQIYRIRPGLSGVDLRYDRGIMLSRGFSTGTDLTLSVTNGAGIGATFDRDPFKNTGFRVSQDVVEGVRIGGYAYFGRERRERVVGENETWILGPDLTVGNDNVELNVQYLERNDDNPMFVSDPQGVRSRGALAELILLPEGDRSRWYGVLLYNWTEIPLIELPGGEAPRPADRTHTGSAHAGWVIARNFRIVGEYTYDFLGKTNLVSVGLLSAF